VRRIVLIALSAIMALVVAIPMASGEETWNKADLTAQWWNWAFQDPSPLDGSYTGGPKCEGEYVDGVFFLASSSGTDVTRTCTVPARMPILFPVVNVIASQPTGDTPPYDEKATAATNDTVDSPSHWYSRLDGDKLRRQRIASGLFQWTIESDNNPYLLPAGTYEAGSDGLWVFLKDGLRRGQHKIVFGGTYEETPFGSFEAPRVTYKLKAVRD
jgi:hypothetical protein